jgi:hypothetical protein
LSILEEISYLKGYTSSTLEQEIFWKREIGDSEVG